MSKTAKQEYGEQLRLRKSGIASSLGPEASLPEAKPHFYADAHHLIDGVREVYRGFRKAAPPYGLVSLNGEPFTGFDTRTERRWMFVEQLLRATARKAFEAVTPRVSGCPYHPALQNLGRMTLRPAEPQAPDVEWLRGVVYPGAQFAPVTIVNILKRMPAMARANGATTDTEMLAFNSARPLLQEPLHHPQQYAKAFNFCLADSMDGTGWGIDRENFMPDEVINEYTALGTNRAGDEAIVWSKSTLDFILRAEVRVANRLEGSERELEGPHITVYPAGTRLGDIRVDEPTIGCPGRQLAYDMWDQTVDVIVGEGLWDQADN